jgi:hypothetical protein
MQNIPLDVVLFLIATHFVFDFVFQSHWMASNKSKNNLALVAHIGTYSLGLAFVVVWFGHLNQNGLTWVVFNAVAHLVTDYFTSRCSSKHFNKNWHDFFVVVGLDQLVHYNILITSWVFFFSK